MKQNNKEGGNHQGHVTKPSKLPPPPPQRKNDNNLLNNKTKTMSTENKRVIIEHVTKPSPLPPPPPQQPQKK